MNKIVYSLTKIGKEENTKTTGLGCILGNDIILACTPTKGTKPYIKVFEDGVKYCHATHGEEFVGAISEIVEVPVEAKNGSTDTCEVYAHYYIWYKKAE